MGDGVFYIKCLVKRIGVINMNYSKWLVRSGGKLECAYCGHRISLRMYYIFCPKCGSEMNTEEYEKELLERLRTNEKQREN